VCYSQLELLIGRGRALKLLDSFVRTCVVIDLKLWNLFCLNLLRGVRGPRSTSPFHCSRFVDGNELFLRIKVAVVGRPHAELLLFILKLRLLSNLLDQTGLVITCYLFLNLGLHSEEKLSEVLSALFIYALTIHCVIITFIIYVDFVLLVYQINKDP
jgi:hypothetical protein